MEALIGNPMNSNNNKIVTSFNKPKTMSSRGWLINECAEEIDSIFDININLKTGIWQMAQSVYKTVLSYRESMEEVTIKGSVLSMPDLHHTYQGIEDITIQEFISNNSFLVPLMNEAVLQIHNIFGTEVVLNLYLFSSVEDLSDMMLFVHINTNLEPIQAVNQLEKFLDDWFIDKMLETKGKLSFDVKIMEG